MSLFIEEREILSALKKAQTRAQDHERTIARLQARLAAAEAKLKLRLTAKQTRAIIDENTDLRRMNEILLKRNQILHRREGELRQRLRRQPPGTL